MMINFLGLLDGNFQEHGASSVDLSESVEDTATITLLLDYMYTGSCNFYTLLLFSLLPWTSHIYF